MLLLSICNVAVFAAHSLDDNASYNEVFNSLAPAPSFRSEVRLRRATVGCELSTGMQSCLSTGDIPSLADHQTTRKCRPKTFFEYGGDELTNWNQLLRSDSSDLDLSECGLTAGTFQTSFNIWVTSKAATNQNCHRLKRPQSNTKTATFYQQVKSHLVIKFLQLQHKSSPAEYVNFNIHTGDIRDQSRKLSKIAPILDVIFSSQI